MFGISPNEIKRIPDNGVYQGCGFVSEELMDLICEKAEIARTKEKRREIVALQVRMLIPSLGLCKGMLVRKKFSNGSKC